MIKGNFLNANSESNIKADCSKINIHRHVDQIEND